MNPVLKQIVSRIFGDLLRKGVAVLGAWLAAKGCGALTGETQNNLVEIAVGAICILASCAWSFFRSHVKDKQIAELSGSLFRVGGPPKETKVDESGKILPMLFAAFLVGSMTGCAVMSNYDQNSYDSAQALKSQSLAVVSHATEPFDQHADEVAALKVKLSAQLAYEQGKGKSNVISAKQWEVLISPDRDLLGRLLADWEAGSTVSKAYLIEKSQQISDGFDQILKLEGAKQR